MASTSRANDANPLRANVEDASDRQQLETAVHYTVGQICDEAGVKCGVTFSKEVIGAITNLAIKQSQIIASDLEHFAKHAKRTTVNDDDVKLLARRNRGLSAHLDTLIGQLNPDAAAKGGKKRKRGRAVEDRNVMEVEEQADEEPV